MCKKEAPREVKKSNVLGELSPNMHSNLVEKGCRKSTIFGCNICNIPLYKDGPGMYQSHSNI